MSSPLNGLPRSEPLKKVLKKILSLLVLPALLSCGPRTVESSLLANVGNDVGTFVGRPVSLDGSKSKDLNGHNFDYVWTIINKPSGSKAVLENDKTSRPVLKPDQAGKFVVQLQITDGTFKSEAVTTTVDAEYPPAAFLSVQTWVRNGSSFAIKLGLATPDGSLINTYPSPGNPGNGFMMLVLNKSDGTVVDGYPKTFPMVNASTDPASLQAELVNLGGGMDKIVILSSLTFATGFALSGYPGLIQALEGIGASSAVQHLTASQPYSLIGTNGYVSATDGGTPTQANAGTGYEYYGSNHFNSDVNSANIAGYFIRDPYQNFRFSYDYLPFETKHESTGAGDTTPVNSIVIGNTVYPPPSTAVIDSTKNGGFFVLVLQRDTLAPVKYINVNNNEPNPNFYQVFSNGSANGDVMATMGYDLWGGNSYGIPWNNQYLVIISALGTLPKVRSSFTNSSSHGSKAESAVDILGGTPGLFPSLIPGSTYSLVGIGPGSDYITSSNPSYSYVLKRTRIPETNYPILGAEASSLLSPGSPSNIRGLLKKDRLGFYVPALWDGGGLETGVDYTLLPIAMQAPSAWRGPDTDKETQIYQDIGRLLLHGLADIDNPDDMRQYYYRTDFSWTDRRNVLSTLTCQELATWQDKTLDCNDSDTLNAFSTMQSRLSEEILYRNDMQSWFYTDLKELLDGMENNQVISLQSDYKNALTLTKVDQTTDVVMDVKTIVSDVLDGIANLLLIMGAPVPLPGDHAGVAPHTTGFSDTTKSNLNRAAAGIGLFSSVSTLAADIAHIADPSWGATQVNTMPGKIKAAASDVFTQIMAQYVNNRAVLDQTFMFMTTDWDKLKTLHGTYSDIYQKSDYMNVLAAMRPGTNVYFYKVLLPVIFHAEPMTYVVCASIDGSENNNPCGFFVCDSGSGKHHQDEKCPYSSSAGYYRPADSMFGFNTLMWASTCAEAYPYSSYYTIWKSNSTSTGDYYDDTNIKLFQPLSSGGWGVQQMNFATRWPFTYTWPTNWSEACNCSPPTTYCP